MSRIPAILIFDIGKTNKKLFLFNQQYELLQEESIQFQEILDEDGFPCENLASLSEWILSSYHKWKKSVEFEIKAINFSAYGASFVLIDENDNPVFPLYNYLKPMSQPLLDSFYEKYGGEQKFAVETASPVLGSLNSGLQLYRLKMEYKEEFQKVSYALHLPQYLSFLITKQVSSDMTSVGCHTTLWDFQKNDYHEWVSKENIQNKLAPIEAFDKVDSIEEGVVVGKGIHDSSAALIPYLKSIREPFVLISTGTWCISLNPFNDTPLTTDELEKDCLLYISYQGKPVKASRLFAGNEHEIQIKRLADFFGVKIEQFKSIEFDPHLIEKCKTVEDGYEKSFNPHDFEFSKRPLNQFENVELAYHQLMMDIVSMQVESTKLVLKHSRVKNIFVDGGFSNNNLYLQLLANRLHMYNIYSAQIAQASALGAAIAIHESWNPTPMSSILIKINQIHPI
jgi:L-fuculokinase